MKAFLAAVALAALPVAAQAVTVPVTEAAPGLYYGTGSVTGKSDVSFDFVVPTALSGFRVDLSGTGVLLDATLTYSLNGGAPVAITSPFSYGLTVGAFGAGTYSIDFDFTGTARIPVSLTATVYGNTEPAPVPVPAAGALAAAGVLAFGALKLRRKTS